MSNTFRKKLIEKLKNRYKIQTRSFSATSHVVAMLYAQLSHALSLNDICDCLRFHSGYLSQIRDCVPPSRNGLAHANSTRDSAMAEELFWTVLAEIKQKYPEFISNGRHYPGLPWRFKRAIHIVDSTTIKLIAKCLDSGCFPRGVGFYVYIFVGSIIFYLKNLISRAQTH